MKILQSREACLILLLLLVGVMSTATIVPFMGVYIVEGLGKDPWLISVYTAITISLTLLVNRQFGRWIDNGVKVSQLILCSIIAFTVANVAIIAVQEYWILVTIGSLCFSISNAATASMYSYGRLHAEQNGLDLARYNSYLRSMTSIGWMLAPALAFYVASQGRPIAVFYAALCLTFLWILIWYFTMSKEFSQPKIAVTKRNAECDDTSFNKQLWLAAFICLFFSLAHTLCMSALPLFYIQEAGLPTYAIGLSFSVKTFIEVGAILGSPYLIVRFGARQSLCFSALIAIAAFFTLSQVTSIGQMVFGAALEGLYYGVFAGVGITYIQSFAEGKIASATSLYMNSLFLGGLVSGSSMGLIAQYYDFKTAIQFSSVWIVAAFVILIIMKPEQVR